jgi:hypothetical protein
MAISTSHMQCNNGEEVRETSKISKSPLAPNGTVNMSFITVYSKVVVFGHVPFSDPLSWIMSNAAPI